MSDHQDGPWTVETVQKLRALAGDRLPVSLLSLKLKRSAESVRAKLAELGITPQPE